MESRALERDAVVVFPEARGVRYWQTRNAASSVPGVWPYGLNDLCEFGDITAVEAPDRGFATRISQRVGGPRRRRHRFGRGEAQSALCWSEDTVLPMLASVKSKRMLAGVIWATDAPMSSLPEKKIAMIRRGLNQMDALWCLSRPQVDHLREWLGDEAPDVHFLRFGVDAKFYAPVAYPERPLVASIGGDRDRDPRTLLQALKRVVKARPDVQCVVQSRRSADDVPDGIDIIPTLTHVGVRDLLSRASVVALATRPNWHASGMTVALEAMSIGRPVIASRTPGMEDYIEVGHTGYLVPPEDPDALAEAIVELLDNPDYAASVGANGTRAVQDRFTTRAMCDSLARIVWP